MKGFKRVVGFSGGADSQACALVVRRAFPAEEILLLNSNAGGNEHPLTEEFIAWYSANVFPVTTVKALVKDMGNRAIARRHELYTEEQELTFEMLGVLKYRFPSRRAQFCTEHLKLAPQRRWCEENLPDGFERYIGVRRDESQVRANALDAEWDEYFDCMVHRPLAAWTKEQVFASLAEVGEPVNPLYKMGFSRIGCAPCINSSKEDVRNWAARFPEMIDKVRAWEKTVGRTFFAPCVPGKAMNWIDEVVAWSKTAHGGKQIELPMFEAEASGGGCVSKYGLCE